MKYSIILITLLPILNGQRLGDIDVRRGADAFYNYEYEKSVKILDNVRKKYPKHLNQNRCPAEELYVDVGRPGYRTIA